MTNTNLADSVRDHQIHEVSSKTEFLLKRRKRAKRGAELPQTKITDDALITIRSAIKQRENLRAYMEKNLTNKALAVALGVSVSTIERVVSIQNFQHASGKELA